ncbi:hypothetical protein [Flavobacterium pectinovorum]|uniref:hypothetical protein n=1 Tax=Flavobacterium pectinovorum TaxID=29533 RepID=UPI0029370085|nr:hypothetical protein [Flavobacterium pectinovorum]
MDKANNNNKKPLSLANSSVLKPKSRKTGKIISAAVAIIPTGLIKLSGINGFNTLVYATKFSQFPQAETCLLQSPNQSATAERKLIESAKRRNILTDF